MLDQSDLLGNVTLQMNEAKPRVIADLFSRQLKLDEIFANEGPEKTEPDSSDQKTR